MERPITAHLAQQKTKEAFKPLPNSLREPVDLNPLADELVQNVAQQQLEGVHDAILQTISEGLGVSNTRYDYTFLVPVSCGGELNVRHYANLMDEVMGRVGTQLEISGFIVQLLPARDYQPILAFPSEHPRCLKAIALVAWI